MKMLKKWLEKICVFENAINEGLFINRKKEEKELKKKAKQLQIDFINAVNNAETISEIEDANKQLNDSIKKIEKMMKPEYEDTVGYHLWWLKHYGPDEIKEEREKIKKGLKNY